MARPSIATRTGDDGTTSLLYGQRVPKTHPQVEAVGTFDELNAAIGAAKASGNDAARRVQLEQIQRDLVALMGELACAPADEARYLQSDFARISDEALARIDAAVASIESRGVSYEGWATPGANAHSAALEVARTVARRGERCLWGLPAHGKTVRPVVARYVNRIADLLWLMAREAEKA